MISPLWTTSALRTTGVLAIDLETGGTPEVGQQVIEVVAVKEAGGRRQTAGQIDVADDVDAVPLDHLMGTVSAQFPPFSAARSTIDRAALHRSHHVFGDQDRRRAVRNECRRDDDVDVAGLGAKQRHLGAG